MHVGAAGVCQLTLSLQLQTVVNQHEGTRELNPCPLEK